MVHLVDVRTAICATVLSALALVVYPRISAAQEPPTLRGALGQRSLEELSQIEVVTVGRRPQEAIVSPASITVISQEDIRRSGVRTIPEALRLANGLHVARSSNSNWAVSTRGFNTTTANKMQVFFDGRSLYSTLFGGVLWDQVDYVLEDIDRIEVIRGPGASLWGGNAVNGVINIITKSAARTQGLLVQTGGGTSERGFVDARYGGMLGENAAYRLYGKYFHRGSLALGNGADANNEFSFGQGGFRADLTLSPSDTVSIHGDLYTGESAQPQPPDTALHGGNLTAKWDRSLPDGSALQTLAYYDRASRFVPDTFDEIRNSYALEFQHALARKMRHEVIWGAGYRISTNSTRPLPILFFEPSGRHLDLFNFFVEDNLSLAERLTLTLGSKFENNTYSGWEVYPTARASWGLTGTRILWGAVSRAVRIPTEFDRDLRIVTPALEIRGNPDFDPEELIAYEVGYRLFPVPHLGITISAYFNDYDNLRSQERPPEGGPTILDNKLMGHTYGVEAGVRFDVTPWWRLRAAYSNLQKHLEFEPDSTDVTGGFSEGMDPRNQVSVRSLMNLPHNTELDFWMRHVSALRLAAPAASVPGYTVFDVRAGWSPSDFLELSIVGRHLPDEQHLEFGSNGQLIKRQLYGSLTWRY
jgi:iron complex outermembrane receptor protein